MNGGISSAFETVKRTADSISSKFSSIKTNIESAVGQYLGTFGNELRNGTLTGVNYQELSQVNAAIEEWLTTIDNDLADLEAKDPEKAFKGEQFVGAITDFINDVKATCHNVSSNLREFQTILNEAIAKYKERDVQLKNDITSSGESVKSQATEYEHVDHQV